MSTLVDIDDTDLVNAADAAITRLPDFGYYGDLDVFGSWGLTITQHRDSGIVDRSNYRTVSAALATFITDHGCEVEDYLDEVHCGHWAHGWLDHLAVRVLIDPDGDVTPENITGAFRWIARVSLDLAEQYPVFDDADHSQLEYDEALAIVTESLRDIRNDAESAVDEGDDGARLVPDSITADDVLSRLHHNGVAPCENRGRYDETATAVWQLVDGVTTD